MRNTVLRESNRNFADRSLAGSGFRHDLYVACKSIAKPDQSLDTLGGSRARGCGAQGEGDATGAGPIVRIACL